MRRAGRHLLLTRLFAPLAFLAVCGADRPAQAQRPADAPSPGSFATASATTAQPLDRVARALELFRLGRRLMTQGAFEPACRAFTESKALHPVFGTMLNLAFCYQQLGKTASAWAEYSSAALAAHDEGKPSWEEQARAQADRLEASLLKVVIDVDAQGDSASFELSLDGKSLPRASWGQKLPVDAGPHELRAMAPRKRPWTTTFEVDDTGRVANVTVPALEWAEPQPREATTLQRPQRPRDAAARSPGGATRTAAVVLGALGLAALGAGAGLVAVAESTFGDATRDLAANCHADDMCLEPAAKRINDTQARARMELGFAGVAAATGAAALVGGAVLWTTAPPRRRGIEVGASIGQGSAGVALRGSW